MTALSDLTEPKVDQGGPPNSGEFVYVDISSVDNQAKHIVDLKRLSADAAPSRARQRLRAGDVLVSMTRPNLNAVALVPPELDGAVGSTGFHVLRAAEKVLPQWLFYGVQSRGFVQAMSELVQGALYPAVRPKDIRAFDLHAPALNEQRRIVAEIEKQFSRLDGAIANLKRIKANLKRYKAAVLKAAVEGRLVPTEAELARREGRSYENGAQLLLRILEARRSHWKGRGKYKAPSSLNESNLPALPEGWRWAAWEQVGFSQNGRPFPSSQYSDAGVKLLRPGNLHESGAFVWNSENTRYMPQIFADQNPDLIVGAHEIVMNLTAQSLKDEFLGRVCLTTSQEHCLLNQRLARLTPIELLPDFALLVFKSPWFRGFVEGLNTGSLIQHMFTSQLAAFAFPLPSMAEQRRIVAEVDRRLSVHREVGSAIESNSRRAQSLRQSVLCRVFSEGGKQ